MTIILIFLLLCVAIPCSAQYTDKDLYQAYLTTDLTLWQEYIDNTPWDNLNNEERTRMLNYQYGFAANVLGDKKEVAKHYLNLFKTRTETSATILSPSTLACYRSAVAAYQIKTGDWRVLSLAHKAFAYSDESVQLDSLNPLALTLKANVDMYCPKAFGGDKERALQYFLRAEHRYRELGLTENNWNYRALQLCIAQCYEKTGQQEQAIRKCQEILKEEPNYEYIRYVYLPILEGREPEKDLHRGAINAHEVMEGMGI